MCRTDGASQDADADADEMRPHGHPKQVPVVYLSIRSMCSENRQKNRKRERKKGEND